MGQRENGTIPPANIADSRYQDLMDDPLGCINAIYDHFGMALNPEARENMKRYLAAKPKGKFGAHEYEVADDRQKERALFKRYQEQHDVPNEV